MHENKNISGNSPANVGDMFVRVDAQARASVMIEVHLEMKLEINQSYLRRARLKSQHLLRAGSPPGRRKQCNNLDRLRRTVMETSGI